MRLVRLDKALLVCLICLPSSVLWSQITNCPGAQVICSDSAIIFNPTGPGFDDFINPNNDPGCLLTGENQSAWYYFAFNALMPPGSVIEFTLTPAGGDMEDYDFAIYGPYLGCDSLGEPIRCSFARFLCDFCPLTGLGMGATDSSEGAVDEDGFVLPIVVNPGEGFYLLLDNFLGNSTGFQLDWGGSAAPFLNCLADPNCSELRVETGDDLVFCGDPLPVTMDGFVSGQSAAATFSWTAEPASATAFLSNPNVLRPVLDVPGGFTGTITYTLTVNDGTCSKDSRVDVTVQDGAQVSISGDAQICQGGSSTLSIAGTWNSILWSTMAMTPTINVSAEGTYTVQVTDAAGCIGNDTLELQFYQVDAGITGSTDLCTGSSLTLSAAPGMAQYMWSDMSTDTAITINSGGIYSLTVTDGNGCMAQSSVLVTERALPTPVIMGPAGICAGTSVTLSVAPIFDTYTWSDMSNADSIEVNTAGMYAITVTDTFGCQGVNTFNIPDYPLNIVAISGDADFCENENTTLTATTGFQTYRWSDDSNAQTLLVNTTGTYSVTATDINGCISEASFQTTILPLPVLTIAPEARYCAGSAVTLDAGSGFNTYQWSPGGELSQSIDVSTTGLYEVEVTDLNGCAATATVDVQENPSPMPQITGNAGFCEGNSTTLSAPGGWASYSWSGGTANTDLLVSSAGLYELTVTDAFGCEGFAQINIVEWMNPTPSISGPSTICPGSTATLDATGPYTGYSWSDNSSDPTLDINADGLFSVTVTDANGCTGEAGAVVDLFTVVAPSIPALSNLCLGDTLLVDAGASYTSYLWSDQSMLQTLEVLAAGDYSVTVEDSNGCISSTDFTVEALANPAATLPPLTGFCENTTLTLDAGAGFVNYLWSNDETTSSITVNSAGTYSVTVTDANNCGGEATTVVEAFQTPMPEIAGSNTFCANDSTALSLTASFSTYNWSTNAQTPQIFATQSGDYAVTVTDMNGCTGSTSIAVTQAPLTEITISGSTSFCEGSTTTLSATPGLSNYLWTGGQQSSSIMVDTSGDYTVSAIDANGCPASAGISVQAIAAAIANAGPNLTIDCFETQVTLGGNNGGNNLSFEWQGPGINDSNRNLPNPVVNVAGQYTLIITIQPLGCISDPATMEVTDIRFSPTVTTVVNDTLDCNTPSLTIVGQAIGGPFQYAWYDAAGNQIPNETTASLSVSTAGTYRLVATDAGSNCMGEATAAVLSDFAYPTANAGANGQLDCNASTLNLNGSSDAGAINYSYSWEALTGNILSGGNTLTPSIDQAGTYVLSVENLRNGCISTDTVSIAQNNQAPNANAGADQTLTCDTQQASLDGTGSTQGTGITYSWQNAAGEVIAESITTTLNQPGTYTLVVTNTLNGCSDMDEALIALNEDQPRFAELEVTNPLCFGESNGVIEVNTISGGTAPYYYSLNGEPFVAISSFANLAPGEYQLSVQDAEGCEQDTIIFIQPGTDLRVELGPDRYIELGDNTRLEALLNVPPSQVSNIKWITSEAEECLGCIEWLVSPFVTTTYSVFVTDTNGCVAEDVVTVFLEKPRNVFIPNVFSPNNDGINDIFMIFAGQDVAKVNHFKVLDRWGEVLGEWDDFFPNDPSHGWNGKFRGQACNTDVFVYFAEIEFIDGEIIIYKGSVQLLN